MFKQFVIGLTLIACVMNTGIPMQGQHPTTSSGPPPAELVPPIQFDSLLNGLRILIVEKPDSSQVTLGLMIKYGAAFDLVGKEGSADLMARLVLRGMQKVNDKPLEQLLQEFNVQTDVAVTWDTTRFTFQAPTKNLPFVLPILAEILTRSTFPESDVTALIEQRLKELRQRQLTASERADREWARHLFGRHPYARPIEGTIQSIESLTPADLIRVHSRFYLANESVLTVIGDVSAQALLPLIRPTFGALRKDKSVPATFTAPTPPSGIQIKVLDQPDSHDASICLGYLTGRRGSDEFLPLLLLNQALIPSWQRVARTFSPTPVTLSSDLNMRALAGSFSISATTSASATPTVISALLQSVEEIRHQGVNQAELDAAKSYFIETFPQQFQTDQQIIEQLHDIELYNLGRDYPQSFNQRVEHITTEQIQKLAAEEFSTTNVYIVVVGPATDLLEGLQKIGTVEVVK